MDAKFNVCETQPNDLFDTPNLRFNANYEIEVGKGIYWVPVNKLGHSRISNHQMQSMLNYTPEEKRQQINTLYEAIQLYQLSRFKGVIDNIDYVFANQKWEFKKPGIHSVRTNEGCCSSDFNWLAYILKGKYEQVGFLSYSQGEMGGHVTNYIFHDGWYYFIDMMMYRADSLPYAGIETGTPSGYKGGIYLSGNLHRTRDPQLFIDYCLQNFMNKPILFILLQQDEIESLGVGFRVDGGICGKSNEELYSSLINDGYDIMLPTNSKATLLYKDTNDKVELSFYDPPDYICNWNEIPSMVFDEY